MCELLWNDPEEDQVMGWKESSRGVGKLFGHDPFNDFMLANNLTSVVRAHQLVLEGNKSIWKEKMITIFSAPNYCYR
jgi:diadenosine tetraphosphatase ApaH/serine/threonine PP2A family protein phosphatase